MSRDMSEAATLPATQPMSAAAAATRSAIIATAERLFRSIGYQKTTVADIARELRMSPANVYRFFASKAAINEAIAARLLAVLDEAVWAVARGPGSPHERIRALFRLLQERTMELFFEERRMHDMVAAALEEHWSAVEGHIHSVDTAFRHIVMDGQAQGVFARIDPEQTARLLHANCVLFTHPVLVEKCVRKDEDLPLLAAQLAEFCLRALRPD
jgi:AcrR family transcriptional regulator